MFKPKRTVFFQRSADDHNDEEVTEALGRMNARKFKKTAERELGPEAMIAGQQRVDTGQQIDAVFRGVESANEHIKGNIVRKTRYSWEMDASTPAIWDFNKGELVLNAKIALCNPHLIPFWVVHEAAHGGLVKGVPTETRDEATADHIAAFKTGIDLPTQYTPEREKLSEIDRIVNQYAAQHITEDMSVTIALKDEPTQILQVLVSAYLEMEKRGDYTGESSATDAAIALFKEAYPAAQVMTNLGPEENTE